MHSFLYVLVNLAFVLLLLMSFPVMIFISVIPVLLVHSYNQYIRSCAGLLSIVIIWLYIVLISAVGAALERFEDIYTEIEDQVCCPFCNGFLVVVYNPNDFRVYIHCKKCGEVFQKYYSKYDKKSTGISLKRLAVKAVSRNISGNDIKKLDLPRSLQILLMERSVKCYGFLDNDQFFLVKLEWRPNYHMYKTYGHCLFWA